MTSVNNKAKKGKRVLKASYRKAFIYLGITIGCLLLSYLIYVITYRPLLTETMADEIAYASFLSQHGSHSFAEGWTSTKPFFPLSTRFFLSFFIGNATHWKGAYLGAVSVVYLIYAVNYSFFAYSLKLKKLAYNIVLAIAGTALGLIGLLLTYRCNYLLSYLSIIFLIAGAISAAIRIKTSAGIKVAIINICILPIIALVIYTLVLKSKYDFTLASPFENLSKEYNKANAIDTLSGLADYLKTNNINAVYSYADVTNSIYVLSGGEVVSATVSDGADLYYENKPDRPQNLDSYVDENSTPFYLVCDTDSEYSSLPAFKYSQTSYQDDYYKVYSFPGIDFLNNEALHTDLDNLEYNEYNAVFLSSYDITTYSTELYNYYTGLESYVVQVPLGSDRNGMYSKYMFDLIFSHEDANPPLVFWGVDPYLIRQAYASEEEYLQAIDGMCSIIESHPDTNFVLTFPYYYIGHYSEYTDEDLQAMTDSYEIMYDKLSECDNADLEYPGAERWLYANPYVYRDDSDIALKSDGPSDKILSSLMASKYNMDKDTFTESLTKLTNAVKSGEDILPHTNLEDKTFLIFGDSIFGNYLDDTSIQNVVGDFGGAQIICKAVGGSNISYTGNAETDGYSFYVKTFYDPDSLVSEVEAQANPDNDLVVFIAFGLNDYFNAVPVDNSKDKYDISSFGGALRDTIEKVNDKFHPSQIVLVSAGFVGDKEQGRLPYQDGGKPLTDYQNKTKEVAEEYNCLLFDFKTDAGITQETFESMYSDDLIHYNEDGRLVAGINLMNFLKENLY